MIALFFAATVFVDTSGFQLKGLNEGWLEKAGGIVLFVSPIGLPLTIGGPFVFVCDVVLALNRHYSSKAT